MKTSRATGHTRRGARGQGGPLPRLLRFVLAAAATLLLPQRALASGLVNASVGAGDTATSGANIAEPLSASGAQFINPAGLAAFTDKALLGGPGVALGRGTVKASMPAGYSKANSVVAFVPDVGLVYPTGNWTFGFSTHGTAGVLYQYGAEPSVGINDQFYSDSSIFAAPLGAAYRVSDRLWLGAEIIPLYASTHLRFTSPSVPELGSGPVPFRYTVSGFGVQALFGVTWKPDSRWSLGLSYRPPGRIWNDGDMALPSGSKQDVELELEAPSVAALGITRRFGDSVKLSYGARWTDTSVFGSSYFRFAQTPSADAPFLPNAQDEWRHAVGGEWMFSDHWTVRGGVAYASRIVGNKGVNPAAFDIEDIRLSTGGAYRSGCWTIEGAFSFLLGGERNVPTADALVLPGTYKVDPAYILLLTLTRKF